MSEPLRDYVYVDAAGRVASTTRNYEGPDLTPSADSGVPGWVDVTGEVDHDDILAGTMELVGEPRTWQAFTLSSPRAVSREIWWTRLHIVELTYIESLLATDATVRLYISLVDTLPIIDLDETGEFSMRAFAAYLKLEYAGNETGDIGWPYFFDDANGQGTADERIAVWFA